MSLQTALHVLFVDGRLEALFLAIALDFVLGTIAAVTSGTFRLSYIADTLRNDVLGKALPFAALYVGWKLAPNSNILVSFINLEVIVDGAFSVAMLALAGSVLSSVKELGLLRNLTDSLAGPDPVTPITPPPPPPAG